jgi:hypothetical protein
MPRRVFPGRAPWSPIVAERNWHRIDEAPKGIGPLLLRDATGPNDPAYVGSQADDGRWFFGDQETHPTHFCTIPLFDGAPS